MFRHKKFLTLNKIMYFKGVSIIHSTNKLSSCDETKTLKGTLYSEISNDKIFSLQEVRNLQYHAVNCILERRNWDI